MKTTSIQIFKRPFTLSALSWVCLAVVLTFSSCGESGKRSSQTNESESPDKGNEPESAQSAQSEFPPHLKFYDDLFARSSCSASPLKRLITGPVTCTQFKDAVIEFGNMYSHVAGTALRYEPTKLPFDTGSAGLIIDLFDSSQARYDLVFHYGYRIENGKGEIVYILSKGELITSQSDPIGEVSYCAFESGENGQTEAHYISLEANNGRPYRMIDQAEFDVMTELYFGNIEYDGSALNGNHARMAYHRADSLHKFYEQYSNENDLHLYISHGAVDDDAVTDVLHAPCLAFGNSTEFFEMDNLTQGPTFRKKGLDIGRLCPPHCSPPLSPCRSTIIK